MNPPLSQNSSHSNTLFDVCVNSTVRVKALQGEPAVCQRLREMGFCEYAEVKKVSQSGACICQVCGSHVKVALSKYLAKNILVEAVNIPFEIESESD